MALAARSFRDLRTWQLAQELCVDVYKITTDFPKQEQFGLTSQMRRAAVSVPSNIAEGFGRQGAREKQQFYHHSLGSLFELQTQIDLAFRLGYFDGTALVTFNAQTEKAQALLLALLQANKAKFINPKSLIVNPK